MSYSPHSPLTGRWNCSQCIFRIENRPKLHKPGHSNIFLIPFLTLLLCTLTHPSGTLTAAQSHATWKKQRFRVIFSCNFIIMPALYCSPVETWHPEQRAITPSQSDDNGRVYHGKKTYFSATPLHSCQMHSGWPIDCSTCTLVLDNDIKNVAVKVAWRHICIVCELWSRKYHLRSFKDF